MCNVKLLHIVIIRTISEESTVRRTSVCITTEIVPANISLMCRNANGLGLDEIKFHEEELTLVATFKVGEDLLHLNEFNVKQKQNWLGELIRGVTFLANATKSKCTTSAMTRLI